MPESVEAPSRTRMDRRRLQGNQTILVWHALVSKRRHIRDMGPELEALVAFSAPHKSAMNHSLLPQPRQTRMVWLPWSLQPVWRGISVKIGIAGLAAGLFDISPKLKYFNRIINRTRDFSGLLGKRLRFEVSDLRYPI